MAKTQAPDWIPRRLRQLTLGRKVLVGSLLAWLAAVVWLVLSHPLMTNPLHLLRQLEQNAVDPSTLSILAMLAPLMFALVALLMLFLLLLGLGCMIQEARLLKRLDQRDPS
ncbi:MAG: hypothetical protein FNT29_03700 [Halothiobacillaceae bacterium]|nr:MAG: hypothetical protein FNT29_03700 [Halothiobacillaceae bacterium]